MEFGTFFELLGVDLKVIAGCVPAIIVATNFFKRVMNLKNSQHYFVIGGMSLLLALRFGLPDPIAVFSYLVALPLASIGAWESAKTLVHKMGKPSTKELELK